MRRYVLIALTAVGLLLTAARPADAQWFFLKWLEELSPPGKFETTGLHVTMLCVSDKETVSTTEWTERRTDMKYLFCDRDPNTWKKVKGYYGFDVSTGWGANNFTYPAGAEKLPHISVKTVSATGAARFNPWIDVGGSVGWARFSGQTGTAFNKTVLGGFVALHPLVGLAPKSNFWQRFLELRGGLYVLPEGLTLQNLGAIGATDSAGNPIVLGADEMKGHPSKSFYFEISASFIK
jgi:hypothetical protein